MVVIWVKLPVELAVMTSDVSSSLSAPTCNNTNGSGAPFTV
jgi:hypothetical protein